MLKYKCLVLDHDDTVVKTTAEIHYPSFKRTIEELRPQLNITRKEFLVNCFDPGFFDYMEKILKFTPAEIEYQLESWIKHIEDKTPGIYDGMKEIIQRQKNEGGYICVVSHSYSEIIKRDYLSRIGILPDIIFGGELEAEKRKPSIYPLEEIARRFDLDKQDIVVVDDLKPGLDMAQRFGCDFFCAGWSHEIGEIIEYMKNKSPVYLTKTEELSHKLFK